MAGNLHGGRGVTGAAVTAPNDSDQKNRTRRRCSQAQVTALLEEVEAGAGAEADDWHSRHFCLFATAVEEAITEASKPASTDASETDCDAST
jgi:hypothetical protein